MNRTLEYQPRYISSSSADVLLTTSWGDAGRLGEEYQHIPKRSLSSFCCPQTVLADYCNYEDSMSILKPYSNARETATQWDTITPSSSTTNYDADDAILSKKDFNWNVVLFDSNDEQRNEHLLETLPGTVLSGNDDTFSVSAERQNCSYSSTRSRVKKTWRSAPTSTSSSSASWGPVVKLPEDFQPLPYSVVVGKCKESKDHTIGNQRLRVLASNFLQKYASNNKKTKSKIVSTLVDTIRDACPMAAFIRLGSDGRWYTVSSAVAREKVGYTFRELLGDKYYRSSSKAKVVMRSKGRKLLSCSSNKQESLCISGSVVRQQESSSDRLQLYAV